MKKTVNIGLAGRAFTMDEDAYSRLSIYLDNFSGKLDATQRKEVMDDLESRIAELLSSELPYNDRVVNLQMVEKIVSQIGMPDGSSDGGSSANFRPVEETKGPKKFYRDYDDHKIGGVCSGLSLYFDIDVTLLRIIFFVCLLCGGVGFWIYIVLWLVAPKAVTPAEKCEMRGWPATAENMAKFYKFS